MHIIITLIINVINTLRISIIQYISQNNIYYTTPPGLDSRKINKTASSQTQTKSCLKLFHSNLNPGPFRSGHLHGVRLEGQFDARYADQLGREAQHSGVVIKVLEE